MSIFSQLPNQLIMRIIRETKSSLHFKEEHSRGWLECMFAIEEIGEEYKVNEMEEFMRVRDGATLYLPNFIEIDQFFCGLYHNDGLTNNISLYRRNGHH
jgi:hypothetical protein